MKFNFFLFLLITGMSYSQQLLPIQYDTLSNYNEIILNGSGEYSSTAMRNEFMGKFINGGYLSTEIKDHSFKKMNGLNITGFDVNSELEYRNLKVNLFKKSNVGLIIKTGYTSVGSMTYSKDAFGLTFYGNEQYIDKTVNLTGTEFKFSTFQKIGLGIIFKKSKSSICFNYFNLQNNVQGSIIDGAFYQPNGGFNDSLKINGDFSSSNGAKFNKGYGFGIDLDLKLKIDWTKEQNAYIQFVVKNLGLATISTGATTYTFDSTYHYSGFKLNQLIGENNVFSDTTQIYSQLGIQKSIQRSNLFLPVMFQVGKIVDQYQLRKLQSFFGIRMFPTMSYIPLVYAGANYKLNQVFDFGLQESYGGFANFRTGLYVNAKIKKCVFGIASENIIGAFNKNGNGKSLIFRLQCRF
jgi:hypothetical protein